MSFEVFFDVETKKLFSDISSNNPADLGVSIVSLYSRQVDAKGSESEGQMQSYWEEDFDKMWPIFQKADRIVGFNSLGFDVPALSPYTNFPFKKLPHFDIMSHVKDAFGRRIKLDSIAQETLDRGKSDSGLNAVEYWRKHDKESLAKLKKYCEEDVFITRDVYDFGLNHRHLKFKDKWNTIQKIEIDFSYPEDPSSNQIGLF